MSDLSFQIAEKDRVGLVGPNGSGKTSLLRVIADEIQLDSGLLVRRKTCRIGYLPQELEVSGGQTVLENVLSKAPGRALLSAQMDDLKTEHVLLENNGEISREEKEEKLGQIAIRFAAAQDRIQSFDKDFQDHVALKILSGLGFSSSDCNADIDALSGGWRMRVVLAGLLFCQPDMLLLDEPTNHLDMPSVAWLGSFLKKVSSAPGVGLSRP